MASGRPVLASVDENSDAWTLVISSQSGVCVEPGNPTELANAILTLRADPVNRERISESGRAWAEKYHSLQSAAEEFEKLFVNIVKDGDQ